MAWCLFGFALPTAIFAGSLSGTPITNVWLWLVIMAVTAVGTNFDIQFSFGNSTVYLAVSTLPIILGVVVLAPWQAAVTCIVAEFAAIEPWRRTKPSVRLFTAATWSVNAVVASAIVHLCFGEQIAAAYALLAAYVAATVFVSCDILVEAVRTRFLGGEVASLMKSMIAVGATDIVISTVGVALVMPFIQSPVLVMIVLSVELGLAIALSKLSTSENRFRGKSEHLQDVFSRYVPANVAEQLTEQGDAMQLGGDERIISVLFCDLRGFTAWSEDRAPQAVVSELNELLTEMSAAVLEADGTLDKYTGDGLMAFWGAPLEQPDHASKAIEAASGMLDGLARCNDRRMERGLAPFSIGIGIHSGRAIVGNIGHVNRLDYTAIGDTVNTAARLEAATKDLGVLMVMSEATHALLNDPQRDECAAIGSVLVKGKTAPIAVYSWNSAAEGQDAPAPVTSIATSSVVPFRSSQ